jgi:hypothetical protein
MKEVELKKLIEKYYNGESTEDEEITLRDYFRQNDITEGYESEKIIFSYYTETEVFPEPKQGFEERIMAKIDNYENKIEQRKINKYLLPIISTAAGLLIMAGSYFFFHNRSEAQDTFSDPKLAYAETMKVLLEVSSQLNHGTMGLEPVSKINKMTVKSFESINKSTIIIEKNLKNLDYLNKAVEIKNSPVERSINK